MKRKKKIHPCAEEVIQRFSDMVFHVALSRTGNYNDAEDITQEVFLKYIQNHKSYEDWEHIKAWLIRVTLNLSKNLVTSAWHRHTAPLKEGMDVVEELPESSDILEAVQKLPEKYREIMRLHYLKGYRVEEISRQLGMNESTVKTRLSRGRKKLREFLGVLLICVVTGAIGFSLLFYTEKSENGREEIPNVAGVVTGNSVDGTPDFSKIEKWLQDDTTIVEISKYKDFHEIRKLTEKEIGELGRRIQKIERAGDAVGDGTSVRYYRMIAKSGETMIFYLKE